MHTTVLAICGLMAISSLPLDASKVATLVSAPLLEPDTPLEEMRHLIQPRIPALPQPSSFQEWQQESETLRERLLAEVVFRGTPPQWRDWKASAVWGDVLESGSGYRIRKLRYEALPGLWIPALLYEPCQIQEKAPAVLNVNGHVGPPGKAIEYEQIRCIHLARHGVISLHPEWLSFGELQGENFNHNRSAYLDLCGCSGLSVFYLAMRGGLDVLCSYADTDPNRVAMTGLSGGGWQTILLSALDRRITLSVPNAGFIGLPDRLAHESDIGDLEQNPTDLLTLADYPLLAALLAPRPALLIYNDKDECCFQSARARTSVFEPVKPFFRLAQAEDQFEFHENINPGTHNYDGDNRQRFYSFLQKHFRIPGLAGPEIHSQTEILSPEQLTVGLPPGNKTFQDLALELASLRPAARTASGGKARLKEILRMPQLSAKSTLIDETSDSGIRISRYRLNLQDTWTVPALVLEGPSSSSTWIAIADEGCRTLNGAALEWVSEGCRVILMDPLLLGECKPGGIAPWKYAQMMAMVGERPLGHQVAQVIAAARWAAQEFAAGRVSLAAKGWTAECIALCAASLEPALFESHQALQGGISSFKDLIQTGARYEHHPSLFCFGLLEEFDLPALEQMSRGE